MDGLISQVLNLPPLIYVVFVLVAVWYWIRPPSYPPNIPPLVQTPYPLLGHLPMLQKNPVKKLQEWRKKKGDIYSFYLGSKLTVVISSWKLLNETLVKQGDKFSDRPNGIIGKIVNEGRFDTGIIGNSGHSWKEQRSTSMTILRNFGMGKNWLADKISEEVEIYIDMLSKFKGEPSDVRMLTNAAVSNVICALLLGDRFELDDPKFIRLLEIVNELLVMLGNTGLINEFPFLYYLPGDMFNAKKIIHNFKAVHDFCQEELMTGAQSLKEGKAKENFITAYLEEMDKKEKSQSDCDLSQFHLVRIIQNLFTAGSETTSTTILWALVFAIRHPEIQEKCYKEIVDVLGPEKRPSMMDKVKLPYTNAFLMETQRMGSIVPLSLSHKCSATANVDGYVIPKDTIIIPNLDAVLLDVTTWGDPETFRPERFLDADNKIVVPDELIPFSIGRRYCMGESLAKMELFLFMTAILQRFHVMAEDPHNPPSATNRVPGVTSAPAQFFVRFQDRLVG